MTGRAFFAGDARADGPAALRALRERGHDLRRGLRSGHVAGRGRGAAGLLVVAFAGLLRALHRMLYGAAPAHAAAEREALGRSCRSPPRSVLLLLDRPRVASRPRGALAASRPSIAPMSAGAIARAPSARRRRRAGDRRDRPARHGDRCSATPHRDRRPTPRASRTRLRGAAALEVPARSPAADTRGRSRATSRSPTSFAPPTRSPGRHGRSRSGAGASDAEFPSLADPLVRGQPLRARDPRPVRPRAGRPPRPAPARAPSVLARGLSPAPPRRRGAPRFPRRRPAVPVPPRRGRGHLRDHRRPRPRRDHRARALPLQRRGRDDRQPRDPPRLRPQGRRRSSSRRCRSSGRAELAERISGDTSVGHALAYCQALEALAGCVRPAPGARGCASLLLELERLYNHVGDVGDDRQRHRLRVRPRPLLPAARGAPPAERAR